MAILPAISGGASGASISPATTSVRIAYVYNSTKTYSSNRALDFATFLGSNGYVTVPVNMSAVTSFDFQSVSAVLIDHFTCEGIETQWQGSTAQRNTIVNSNKPVVGLGRGGAGFFNSQGLWIGNSFSVTVPSNPCAPVSTTHQIFTVPTTITGTSLTIATTAECYYRTSAGKPADVNLLVNMTFSASSDHFPIMQEAGKYYFWGFTEKASALSATGKSLFLNLLYYIAPPETLPPGNPLDITTIQWIIIAGLAVGLVIAMFVAIKRGRKA